MNGHDDELWEAAYGGPQTDDDYRAMDDEALYWSGQMDDEPTCTHPLDRQHWWHAHDGALCCGCNDCGAVLGGGVDTTDDDACPFCRGELEVGRRFQLYCPTCDVGWDDSDELDAGHAADRAADIAERDNGVDVLSGDLIHVRNAEGTTYTLTRAPGGWLCNCPAFTYRPAVINGRHYCKHIMAHAIRERAESGAAGYQQFINDCDAADVAEMVAEVAR